MNLDFKLTQLGVKMKKLVVVDVHFPEEKLHEFKRAYPHRYLHFPGKEGVALEVAAGLASMGKHVLVYGTRRRAEELFDVSLNVRVIREAEDVKWWDVESSLKEFGAGDLLIPKSE